MPPEDPLPTVVHSSDPQAALRSLDVDAVEDIASDAKAHHHQLVELDDGATAEKAIALATATVGDHAGAGDHDVVVEPTQLGQCEVTTEDDKDLGGVAEGLASGLHAGDVVMIADDPVTPEIEGRVEESADGHGMDEAVDDTDFDAAGWGTAID
jgi:hypothetical protein